MFNKIKNLINEYKQKKAKDENLLKAKQYYELLRGGALFLKYIHEDLIKQRNSMPRSERRRIEDQIVKKGQFTKEIINKYKDKVDSVLEYIKIQENKKK